MLLLLLMLWLLLLLLVWLDDADVVSSHVHITCLLSQSVGLLRAPLFSLASFGFMAASSCHLLIVRIVCIAFCVIIAYECFHNSHFHFAHLSLQIPNLLVQVFIDCTCMFDHILVLANLVDMQWLGWYALLGVIHRN